MFCTYTTSKLSVVACAGACTGAAGGVTRAAARAGGSAGAVDPRRARQIGGFSGCRSTGAGVGGATGAA
eukprot:7724760-Pyramimonas_sp.AAC.1